MDNFNNFFKSILKESKVNLKGNLGINEIRNIILKINEYFYTNYEDIGNTYILGGNFEYFSEFHKFWEKYHKEIIDPYIDEKKCEKVADILYGIYIEYGSKPFKKLYDVFTLTKKEICNLRYFSANQDFRGSRNIEELIIIYQNDPSIFNKNNIYENPEDFLKNIGITSLSQSDKRIKFAQTAALLLIEKNIEPYDLLNYCNNDIGKVRNLLINNTGSGFGNKKTDIFLRDMVTIGVWKKYKNFEVIDVASDINTIKVALRTGILKTQIPLVSSFLDIFCYQYSLIDKYNALAWRKVWEIWRNKYKKNSIEAPCLMDYLIYRIIGKEFCRESLCFFKCESQDHIFKWHSARNKTCQICYKNNIKNNAKVIKKVLPCTDDDGYLSIEKSKFISGRDALLPNLKECPFAAVCDSKSKSFLKLNPPKSISILGRTGWESARTRSNEGGGGLMS